MDVGPISNDLLKKIKDGLVKSGFPLELRIAREIDKRKWAYSIGTQYLDFETDILREADITASKEINGIKIHLIIECKKSDEKQLVLYQPKLDKVEKYYFASPWFKAFPRFEKGAIFADRQLFKEFRSLPLLNPDYNLSTNIIFTKGNYVEQSNTAFFNSLNGLLKRSVIHGSDGFIETGYRILYFYIVIYDGYMLSLTQGDNDEINLTEIDYGQYKMQYYFSLLGQRSSITPNDINYFGSDFVIEIMKPSFLVKYLDQIAASVENVNKIKLKDWGEDWPEIPF